MNEASNNTITTLLLKHLPDFISKSAELQQKYFRPYKPLDVRFMQTERMPGFVFLDFVDRDKAEEAYQQLRKINFGLYFKEITVEYATPNPGQQPYTSSMMPAAPTPDNEKAAEPVSTTHGLLYPPNPHLKYYYPDPTPDIVTNISYAIASVPRLYTQVLHLMNKMNMPPPFGPNVKEAKPAILSERKYRKDELLASDESELDDEAEDKNDQTRKRVLNTDIESPEERLKRIRLVKNAAVKQKEAIHQHKAVSGNATKNHPQEGASATVPQQQKKQQTYAMASNQINNKIKIVVGSSLDTNTPLNNDQETRELQNEQEETKKRANLPSMAVLLTNEQKAIKDKCLPMSELTCLAAFKRYEAGQPYCKLYVKNLHKHVTEEDLQSIFGLFSKDVQIELMTKGKLKGQAFITFPDTATARLALDCTNGYPLKADKPMAVQFGRATKPTH